MIAEARWRRSMMAKLIIREAINNRTMRLFVGRAAQENCYVKMIAKSSCRRLQSGKPADQPSEWKQFAVCGLQVETIRTLKAWESQTV